MIIAVATLQDIVPRAAHERVIASATGEAVISRPAVDGLSPLRTNDAVVPAPQCQTLDLGEHESSRSTRQHPCLGGGEADRQRLGERLGVKQIAICLACRSAKDSVHPEVDTQPEGIITCSALQRVATRPPQYDISGIPSKKGIIAEAEHHPLYLGERYALRLPLKDTTFGMPHGDGYVLGERARVKPIAVHFASLAANEICRRKAGCDDEGIVSDPFLGGLPLSQDVDQNLITIDQCAPHAGIAKIARRNRQRDLTNIVRQGTVNETLQRRIHLLGCPLNGHQVRQVANNRRTSTRGSGSHHTSLKAAHSDSHNSRQPIRSAKDRISRVPHANWVSGRLLKTQDRGLIEPLFGGHRILWRIVHSGNIDHKIPGHSPGGPVAHSKNDRVFPIEVRRRKEGQTCKACIDLCNTAFDPYGARPAANHERTAGLNR